MERGERALAGLGSSGIAGQERVEGVTCVELRRRQGYGHFKYDPMYRIMEQHEEGAKHIWKPY